MASRSSRARRSRRASTDTAGTSANGTEEAAKNNSDKTVSHLTHHRMIARNLNALRENFGELRKQVVDTERQYKRGDKSLDTSLFQTRNQVEALEKRLVDFIEEMTEVAFNSNLEIRGNSDRIAALWEALESVAPDAADIKRRREECEKREEARQHEIDRRLQDLAEDQKTNGSPKRAPRKAVAASSKRKSAG
ncbi:MAG: hypothetical protein OXG17_01730 [Chloroflexi bacterium]|nr:hypothetical protein [Chloroflexota bacterium]